MSKEQELHYFRTILGRLNELKSIASTVEDTGFSIQDAALADEIDWLDCYIDSLERAKQETKP